MGHQIQSIGLCAADTDRQSLMTATRLPLASWAGEPLHVGSLQYESNS